MDREPSDEAAQADRRRDQLLEILCPALRRGSHSGSLVAFKHSLIGVLLPCVYEFVLLRCCQCAEAHFQQSIQTRDELALQEEEREFRKGNFMKSDAPLPMEPEELTQYNRLSYNPHDVGIFRAQDYNEEAEWDAVDAEEVRCVV